MEDTSVSGLDNSKLEAIAHEIYTELVEDACLGLCFEAYHCTKCSNFYLDDKTHAAQDTQTSWLCRCRPDWDTGDLPSERIFAHVLHGNTFSSYIWCSV
uniref:Uncharacterized protein n=1 Tax=Anas platyrhynchos TaxID=8839 RepID=A0A8B9R5J5_ANAPL